MKKKAFTTIGEAIQAKEGMASQTIYSSTSRHLLELLMAISFGATYEIAIIGGQVVATFILKGASVEEFKSTMKIAREWMKGGHKVAVIKGSEAKNLGNGYFMIKDFQWPHQEAVTRFKEMKQVLTSK